jgi:predicted transcriptional regulator of viral defense system
MLPRRLQYRISNFKVSATHRASMRFRSLSATEARVVLSLEAAGEEELSLDTIADRGDVGRGFARKLAHTLQKKGWIQRVGRGRYLLNPVRHGPDALPDSDPIRVGSHLVRPYFFGFATAAELWGYLHQAGRVYYIAAPVRTSVQPRHVARFRFVRVRPSQFFGLQQLSRRGSTVWVSDRERTVLDCVARPELSGGPGGVMQILSRAKVELSWSRLSTYLRKSGNLSLARRVGFLAEWVRPSVPLPRTFTAAWRPTPDDPWVPLGPVRTYGRTGPHDPRWHIVRNVPERTLLSEVDRR